MIRDSPWGSGHSQGVARAAGRLAPEACWPAWDSGGPTCSRSGLRERAL